MRWFGIPVGLGIACLAALQLQRTVRRERRGSVQDKDHQTSWQVTGNSSNLRGCGLLVLTLSLTMYEFIDSNMETKTMTCVCASCY